MYATRCPVCLSELFLNERRVVHLADEDAAEAEAIFTCLVCGSDVVAAWLPGQRGAAETTGDWAVRPR